MPGVPIVHHNLEVLYNIFDFAMNVHLRRAVWILNAFSMSGWTLGAIVEYFTNNIEKFVQSGIQLSKISITRRLPVLICPPSVMSLIGDGENDRGKEGQNVETTLKIFGKLQAQSTCMF